MENKLDGNAAAGMLQEIFSYSHATRGTIDVNPIGER